MKMALSKRKHNSHKGDYGHVLVLAGSRGLTGAAYLTSQAALLSGSGLVTLGLPKSLNVILAKRLIEVMTKPLSETSAKSLALSAYPEITKFIRARKIDVLAIGPGLSQNAQTQKLVRKLIKTVKLPTVIDADGINALVGNLKIFRFTLHASRFTIVTPHPGEMARLLRTSSAKVQKDRKGVAKSFAKKYNVICVLKGHRTVVAAPSGRIYINNTGNPGMASGGCGDVLTGMIASFLGQGLEPFKAACIAVHLHGSAGDAAARQKGQHSLIATDLLHNLPRVIKSA